MGAAAGNGGRSRKQQVVMVVEVVEVYSIVIQYTIELTSHLGTGLTGCEGQFYQGNTK